MKVSVLSILTDLLVVTYPYHTFGKATTNSTVHETTPHKGCQLILKDKEPPHKPLVGKGYEGTTTTRYKVENEAGAMAARCINGFAAGYPCRNVNLLSMLPIIDLDVAVGTSTSANDVWGWTDVSTGREFALIGLQMGTTFVEITDPVNPIYLGGLPTEGVGSTWRDIKTFGDFAFIVSEEFNHGMQVFDLRNLLTASVGTEFSNTARYTEIGAAHNIFINEDTGFAYIVGAYSCSGGLHMVDVNNPTNPEFAGCYSGDGYTHDVQCVIYDGPDSTYTGKEICFASNEDTITIVDVTDKSSPIFLSKETYENDGYTHQGWLTEDHSHFIFNDELDEYRGDVSKTATHVMDVSDLNSMTYVGKHMGRTSAMDHNNYVLGDYLYQANYRAGFNMLKINNAANAEFEEAAFFDIYPNDDLARSNGAWSTYPYFPSGTIIVSGIESGLFMLEFLVPPPTVSPGPSLSLAPTSAPTTLAPTASPTACNGVYVTVELRTDNYPSETSWDITDENGLVVMQNGELDYITTFVTSKCLNQGCYFFEIRDSFGDGICCGLNGDGSFSLTQNGVEILSGGDFGVSDSVNFCIGATYCVDSGLSLFYEGNLISCEQVAGACSNPVVSSHCPLTCDACEEYQCKNSMAPLKASNVFTCNQLASADPLNVANFCTTSDSLFTTCRDTCGFCI